MLMLPFLAKARRTIKTIMEETFLQEEMQMVSRMQEEMVIIKGSQGKKTSEVHQGNLLLPGTKVYFLVIAILVQYLGTWKNIVGNITKIIIMVLVHLREEILKEEVMNFYTGKI